MQPYRSYEDKLTDVVKIFAADDRWLTRRQIAKRLGYLSSQIVIDVLEDMVERGWVEKGQRERPQGVAAVIYRRKFWTDDDSTNPNKGS